MRSVICEREAKGYRTVGIDSATNDFATSQPACTQRSRDDIFDAPAMEWNDEKEVHLSGPVVHDANGRHDHARAGSPKFPKHGEPEVQMPVVSASNELIVSYAENRPRTNRVAHCIAKSSNGRHDFCVGGYRKSTPLGESVPQYQNVLDPTRMMAKDAEENFDDTSRRCCQWSPVGIAEVGCGDQSWLKRTYQRHIAFNGGGPTVQPRAEASSAYS